MFCPNCGAQNQDTATACAKCGFALKAAAAAPKFKGTMLMMNAPATAKPPAPAPAAPAAGAPPPAAPAGGPAAAPPGPQPPAGAAALRPKLKGTMIGVAPPSMGSNTPPPGSPPSAMGAPPAGAIPPPPANLGATPPGFGGPPAGFGAPPAGFGAPPQQGFGSPPPGFDAPAPPPAHASSSAVNPLGGTVVADAGAFGGGFPQAPAPHAGGYDIGGPPPGFGVPNQDGGFGATAPAMGSAPMVPTQTASMDQMDDMMPIPGMVGGANPIVTVLLIVLTCGLYGIYLLVKGKKSASPPP